MHSKSLYVVFKGYSWQCGYIFSSNFIKFLFFWQHIKVSFGDLWMVTLSFQQELAGTALLQLNNNGMRGSLVAWWLRTSSIMKIIYEARFPKPFSKNENKDTKDRSNCEYQLVATFLSRIQMNEIKSALNWIQIHH